MARLGRRPRPRCGHYDCETHHQGRCLREDPIVTSRNALRAARERAGLTQEEAAALVHQSGGRVWRRWENGERAVNEAAAHLFAIMTDQRWPLREPDAA